MQSIFDQALLLGYSGGMPLYVAHWNSIVLLYPATISETHHIPELNSINYN